jgi:hypothetical protein
MSYFEHWKKKKNPEIPRLFYPAKLSHITEIEIKIIPDKQKLKQFMTTKPSL